MNAAEVMAHATAIMGQLDPAQIAYAADQMRGDYRGFAALHDLTDANEYLISCGLEAMRDIETANAVEVEVTRRIVATTEKPTPGPWKVEPEEMSEGQNLVICSPGWVLAAIAPEEGRTLDGADRANARLMAAAPELLAALRIVATAEPGDDEEIAAFMLGYLRATALAAIAKAEGGAA